MSLLLQSLLISLVAVNGYNGLLPGMCNQVSMLLLKMIYQCLFYVYYVLCSVKFVGLFVVILAGVSTISDLWDLLGDLNLSKVFGVLSQCVELKEIEMTFVLD